MSPTSRFCTHLFRTRLLWLLILAGLGPAFAPTGFAQTPVPHPSAPVSLPAAPHPVMLPVLPVPPVPVLTPLPTSLQVALLTARNAALSAQLAQSAAQLAATQAALAAKTSAAAPSVAFGPYTNTTGNLVGFHYQVCNVLAGTGPIGGVGSVAGYVKEEKEAQAAGGDFFALDFGALSGVYPQNIAGLFAAAHQVPGFKLLLTPDFSGVGEDPASLTQLATLFLQYASDPACLKINGRPALSTYTGDGGGPSVVAAVYKPFLAQVRAGCGGYPGTDVFFIPGWGSADELAAAGADGGWVYPSGDTPLGDTSPLPDLEALGASVSAASSPRGSPLVWMQPGFFGYWGNNRVYNNYAGGKGQAAYWDSAFFATHPKLMEWVTFNDGNEGSQYTSEIPGTPWPYINNATVPGFYTTQDGLHKEFSYYAQRYKTGQAPIIADDTVIVYNRTQAASVTTSPANNALLYIHNPSGDPAGLRDEIDVTAILKASGFVEVQNGTLDTTQFAPAGVSHLTFPAMAGNVNVALKRQGQVIRQLAGQTISATGTIADGNVASFASVPGIAFSLTVPMPSFPLDRAALFVRSTRTADAPGAIGVCNLSAADGSVSPPAVFAQNSLNNPAGVGQLLDRSTAAGQDALQQYNGNGYAALYQDPLGLYPTRLAYDTLGNTNTAYFMAGKAFPSSKIVASVRVVSTSNDPNADGQGGIALVSSTAPNGHYQGQGVFAYIEKYAGGYTLTVKTEDNLGSDSMSSGPSVLGSMTVNSLAPGEWYDVTVTADLVARTATFTARPSNQHL